VESWDYAGDVWYRVVERCFAESGDVSSECCWKRMGLAALEWDYYGMFVEEFRAYWKGYDTGQVNLVLPNLWQRPGTGYYSGPVYDSDEDRKNDCILHLGFPV
jgi:hypothetical protein